MAEAKNRPRRRASQKGVLEGLVAAGIKPFPRPDEHAFARTIDDGAAVTIDLGPNARQRRILPSVARRKGRPLINDFVEFARDRNRRGWRYWNIRPLQGKIAINQLNEGVIRFGREIGDSVEYLQGNYGLDVFVVVLQVRMDNAMERFDVHAHMICDVTNGNEAAIRDYLRRTYAEVDASRRRIRDVDGAVGYTVPSPYDHASVPDWPADALRAAWRLSGGRTQLIRTYGSFARWRRDRSAGPKAARKGQQNKANASEGPGKAVSSGETVRYGPTSHIRHKGRTTALQDRLQGHSGVDPCSSIPSF